MPPIVKLLDWRNDANTMIAPRGDSSGGCYRIVYSHGYHCLRLEVPGSEFKWMGQFPTVSQAKLVAQEQEEKRRRLKAWERYMERHDPPSDTDPDWQP